MDRITKSYLDTFSKEQSLGGMSESNLFEYFAAFCVVSSTYDEEFDTADVHVGGEDDLGLDALAIIINGVLVTSVEEAEDLLSMNGFLDVKFVLGQAKTSSNFNGEQITTFLDGAPRILRRGSEIAYVGRNRRGPCCDDLDLRPQREVHPEEASSRDVVRHHRGVEGRHISTRQDRQALQ